MIVWVECTRAILVAPEAAARRSARNEKLLRTAIVGRAIAAVVIAVTARPVARRPGAVAPVIAAVAVAVAIAALALVPEMIELAAAFGFVIAEPGGDLVPGAFEEAAVLGAAAVAVVTVVRPSCAFIARAIPRVIAVMCHMFLQLVDCDRRGAGRKLKEKTNGGLRPFLCRRGFGAPKRWAESLVGQAIARG